MATKITSSDSMRQAAEKINTAFAALDGNETFEQVSQNDSMSAIAGKVQRNFAKVTDDDDIQQVASTDNMSDIADKLDNNFAIAEMEEPVVESRYTFLHCSDPHGVSGGGLEQIVSALSDQSISFGLISGDLRAYGSSAISNTYKGLISQKAGRMLAVPGNHDTIDAWAKQGYSGNTMDQRRTTSWFYEAMGSNVNWGDALNGQNVPDAGSYWYKDFGKLRVIGIDQYCYDQVAEELDVAKSTTHPGSEKILYSQAEIDWLVNLLANTDQSYHVIITFHDAPTGYVKPSWVYDDGNWNDEALFYRYCSASSFSTNTSFGGGSIIQKIVKNWIARTSETITETRTMPAASGNVNYTVSAAVDFSQMEGDGNFVCYLCGHQHVDFGWWLDKTNYPNQLVMLITAAHTNVGFSDMCDLNIKTGDYTQVMADPTEPQYRYNRMTYDADNRTLLVERIGQRTAVNRDTLGENYSIIATTKTRLRDKLLFDLDIMVVTHPQEGGES